jgi:septal ring factor EnvC (AmiA/AmiB activator)
MRSRGCCRTARWIGALAFVLNSGCCVPHWLGLAGDSADARALTHKQMAPVLPVDPIPPPPTPSDQISLMSQRLASAEDDRKVLATRLQQAETLLEEKEQALFVTGKEIQAATEEVGRTRADLQRFKQEMESLRGRLKNIEKEDRETLESIIRMLEQMLDQDKAKKQPAPAP